MHTAITHNAIEITVNVKSCTSYNLTYYKGPHYNNDVLSDRFLSLFAQVLLKGKAFSVFPDDILAVQHTRKSGEFLRCTSGSDSAWRQSYISIPGPEWGGWVEMGKVAETDAADWVDDMSCDLRLIYKDPGHLYGPVVNNTQSGFGVDPSTSDIQIDAQTPVTGMQILYPVPHKEHRIDIAVNTQTLFIIKILSGRNATSSWSAPVSRAGVPFLTSCPAEISEIQKVCQRDSPDTRFSSVYVMFTREGKEILNITASNQMNSQMLRVRIHAHVLISGLRIQPQGFHRVLVNIPQVQYTENMQKKKYVLLNTTTIADSTHPDFFSRCSAQQWPPVLL